MNDIIVIRTESLDKNIVYDYINDKLFLVEADEDNKLTFSTYGKAKVKVALFWSLCIPLFLIIKYVNVPVIIFYLMAICLRKHARRLLIEPATEKVKIKHWEPISHEKASQIIEDFNIIGYVCLVLGSMTLCSLLYCCYDSLEMKSMGLFGIVVLGSIFLANVEDSIIAYKLSKKLKKLKNNL